MCRSPFWQSQNPLMDLRGCCCSPPMARLVYGLSQLFFAATFPWRNLLADDRFHKLEAVGLNGSTTFFVDGTQVAVVHAQPKHLLVGRIGGDADCGRSRFRCAPQGAGELMNFQVFGYAKDVSAQAL
eukprot:gnl/TRDRNA2_/TRDRNA2_141430_c1_seq1.p1 gnl/TRDRNA2_/TRDRNA2_141430_c1~~gnl/TRDRNA2_/TRDRNA2_141430_c1_seq1.p1  ORF type:complete len:127 (+),score=9.05 gnl/TRDRNA2_/TRDRNA2_141430_c1_seq1:228-608(+)